MKRWEEYQHQAAGLLRELGFSAEVNASLTEPNGAEHAIDVAARRTVAGVDLLWIVECKYWKRSVDMGAVRDLRSLVLDLGADRGLLMSESGFQSGAIMTAKEKNITLTSLVDLRANAAEELLAARVVAAEKRLMDLTLRVNRGLRPSAPQAPRRLVAFAPRRRPEDLEEFTSRPAATDFDDGMVEVQTRIEGLTPDDFFAFAPYPGETTLPWRLGIDPNVMDGTAAAVQETTEALHQGRLDQWPAGCPAPGAAKLAWSMRQLIDVVELMLPGLEQKVTEQEEKAAQVRKRGWPRPVE